ncbi:MAG: glycoside hydrolase family 3 protein, partial [bacterium]
MTSVTRNRSIPEVPDLTLEEKIGQMLCLGWSAPDCLLQMNEQARECIAEMKAGGMIIMSRNVSPNQQPLPPVDSEAVSNMLHEMQSAAEIPLFIATDQEGGRVARFGAAPFTRMPSALTIGQRGDEELAYQAAFVTAQELASVGVNWNFAPTADINSNPANPVIGDRSFGATATVVDPMVRAQVKGYQDGGILACAKHFPGHGDTSQDSHFDLPTLPFGSEIMQERELVPFIGAIQAGVGAIMTAHILFPALDAEFPATLSHPILTGLLREKLGFEGLIVTDCLEMKAIADHWGTARAAVLAAKAGADVLLI